MTDHQPTTSTTVLPDQPAADDFPAWRAYIDAAPLNTQERIDRLNAALCAAVPIRELLKNRDGKEA